MKHAHTHTHVASDPIASGVSGRRLPHDDGEVRLFMRECGGVRLGRAHWVAGSKQEIHASTEQVAQVCVCLSVCMYMFIVCYLCVCQ
jgi:hypothetical protein